jgi:hypothetical protein
VWQGQAGFPQVRNRLEIDPFQMKSVVLSC